MSTTTQNPTPLAPDAGATVGRRLSSARVLLAGLGNIGSFLAVLLAPLVGLIRLVDRDSIEVRNATNQLYRPEDQGQAKVDVVARQIAGTTPQLQVERRIADVEDLPWEDYADVDIVMAGLDSLRARQLLLEKHYPLNIPYIDGAVGDPLLARVQVLLPGQACLECNWAPLQYRQLMREVPCRPNAPPNEAPRTMAPGCAGAAVAAVMVAQCMRLFSEDPPRESYEIYGDLLAGRFVQYRRGRNVQCRYRHEVAPQLLPLEAPLSLATVADLIDVVRQHFAGQRVQLEFRRGILGNALFATDRLAEPEQLRPLWNRRLSEMGLTPRDRVVVRAVAASRAAHICFDSPTKG